MIRLKQMPLDCGKTEKSAGRYALPISVPIRLYGWRRKSMLKT